jgi:hypothetical protein
MSLRDCSHRQNFPAGGLELLEVRLGFGLDVAADERFGAAGAEVKIYFPASAFS